MSRLLSVKEFSAQVGNHPQSTYRLIWRGELKAAKKRGLGWRVLEDPAEWLKKDQINDGSSAQEIKQLQKMILSTPPDGDITLSGGACEMPKGKTKSRLNLGYGAIYQRRTKQGITRWYLDFRNGKGERVQKVTPEAITARDAIHALKKEVLKTLNDRYGPKVKKIGFPAFSKLYLQNYVMVKRRHWDPDKFRLDALSEYFKDNQDLREITPMTIQGLIKVRQEAGNVGSTINRFLALLKHLLNKAIEESYVEENPVRKIKFFSERENRIERVLTKDEEARLLAHSSGYLRSVLIIGLNTGMRLGEILNLKWGQIDFGAGKIVVEMTKSGKPRVVFINSPLLAELQGMKSLNGKCLHLFLNEQTGKPMTLIRRSFLTACRKAGISKLRLHDLRHTFASRLLERGADIETVRSLLGHYSITMTQRYVHSRDEAKKKAVELLNDQAGKSTFSGENLLHPCDMTDQPTPEPISPLPQNRWRSWN